jgi:hypothetical protein
MRQDADVSYADLERLGWPQTMIDDYQGMKRDFTPQSGIESDPNGVYESNRNGFYVDTSTPALWYNPVPGELTGWIQL